MDFRKPVFISRDMLPIAGYFSNFDAYFEDFIKHFPQDTNQKIDIVLKNKSAGPSKRGHQAATRLVFPVSWFLCFGWNRTAALIFPIFVICILVCSKSFYSCRFDIVFCMLKSFSKLFGYCNGAQGPAKIPPPSHGPSAPGPPGKPSKVMKFQACPQGTKSHQNSSQSHKKACKNGTDINRIPSYARNH